MKKTLITLALAGLALAGCGSPIEDSDPVELSDYRPGGSEFIGPVEASLPAHSLTETRSQSLGDILAPPTPAEPQEPIQGLLPPTSPWQPAPAPWQVELPEVTDLPPLPAEK